MQSLWNDAEAATYEGLLGQRVYSSRLLGRNHSLVLSSLKSLLETGEGLEIGT